MARELGDDIETRSDPPPPTRWRAVRPWLEGAAIALVLAGIVYFALGLRGGSSDDPSERSTPDTATTTSTSLSPEAEVEASYRSFLVMLHRLGEAPDQNDPEIDQRTTSDFNFRLKLVMADRKTKGLAVDFGPQDGVVSIRPTVDGNEATVKSCYVDQSAIVKKATGAVVNPMRTVKESMTVNLVREGDAWKIRRLAVDRKPGTRVLADCSD